METIEQLVIQLKNEEERVFVITKDNNGLQNFNPTFIYYSNLNESEKEIWDNFVNMIKNR